MTARDVVRSRPGTDVAPENALQKPLRRQNSCKRDTASVRLARPLLDADRFSESSKSREPRTRTGAFVGKSERRAEGRVPYPASKPAPARRIPIEHAVRAAEPTALRGQCVALPPPTRLRRFDALAVVRRASTRLRGEYAKGVAP